MNLRQSVLGPASTTAQAVTGAIVAFGVCLLMGLALHQGPTALMTAFIVAVAVLTIGLKRARSAAPPPFP
jgi:hypothetical protein